jgi:gliding motility-associated-like protein
MVTDSKGCFDTLSLTIEEPATTVVVISNKPTICLGQTATLTAQAYGGNGPPYTFNWQPIAGVGNTLTVSPTQTETYYVVAYDKKGCISNVEAATVTVYSLFAGDIDIIMKNPICKGTSTTITAVSNGNNTGPLTYTWNQGLGYGPGPFTITPTAPGVYQVTVSTVCGTTVIVRDTLKFIPPPKPGFKADSLKGCYPLLVNFTDTSIQNPNDPAINWIWNFGDGTSSTDRNPTHIYYTPGTYYVTLNVQTLEGCNVISPQNAVKIVVHPHPTAAFTPNPQYVYTPYGTVYFNNQSKNATSYLWDFGNGITSTVSSPTYTYTEVGTYTITLISTDKNGCKDTITKEIIVSGDFIMPNAFTPNPDGPNGGVFDPTSLDNDVFNAYAKGVKEYKLHIFNRWGELIFESTDPKIGWDGYYREKLCQAGVYIWQVYIKFLDDREFKKVGDVNLIR